MTVLMLFLTNPHCMLGRTGALKGRPVFLKMLLVATPELILLS